MQKVYLLLLILFSLTFVPKAEASHVLGGEITWRCTGALGQSQYIFFMTIYRDCSGAEWAYQNETLKIFGSPLPRNSVTNAEINSIMLYPDSVKWQQMNNGDLSPVCDPNGVEQGYRCSAGDPGTVQAFYYKSDPIDMKGVPPSTGWRIVWDNTVCCRLNVRNLAGGASGVMILRAHMYPDKNRSNVAGCLDNSPEFRASVVGAVCKGQLYTYNSSAGDYDLDFLVYAWDRTYDAPAANPTPRAYVSGFNYNNPTPGPQFDNRNVAATIDSITGIERMAVYSGGAADKYLTVIRVDAYREGTKIASVFREIPLVFFNCPPIGSTTPNKQPDFYFDSIKQKKYEIVVEAGDKIAFPIQVVDNDTSASGRPQEVTLIPYGGQFANDLSDTSACLNPPCAILKNGSPQYDSSLKRYQINGDNFVSTNFEWQTNCGHLNADGTEKTYYFYISGKDDHCPVPQQVFTYVKVTVKGDTMDYSLKMECAGDKINYNQISWAAGADIAGGFSKWYIYAGTTRFQLQLIDSVSGFNTTTYVDSTKYNHYQVKTLTTCNNQEVELKTNVVEAQYFKLLNNPAVIQIECVEQLSSTNTVTWSVDKSIENEFKQWYIYASNTPPLQLVDSIAGFNTRAYVDNQKLAYYQVKASISSVCVNDTVTLKSTIRRRGYQRYPIDVSISDSNRIITAQDSAADSYQWYDCNADTIITDSIRQSFAPQDSGSFAAIITKGYCTDTTECVKVFSVGLNENHFQNSINFYPNPTEGSVTIKTGAIQESLHLKVRNIHGQLVQEEQFVNQSNLQLQLTGKSGIYFIELENAKGERANVKVVKR